MPCRWQCGATGHPGGSSAWSPSARRASRCVCARVRLPMRVRVSCARAHARAYVSARDGSSVGGHTISKEGVEVGECTCVRLSVPVRACVRARETLTICLCECVCGGPCSWTRARPNLLRVRVCVCESSLTLSLSLSHCVCAEDHVPGREPAQPVQGLVPLSNYSIDLTRIRPGSVLDRLNSPQLVECRLYPSTTPHPQPVKYLLC